MGPVWEPAVLSEFSFSPFSPARPPSSRSRANSPHYLSFCFISALDCYDTSGVSIIGVKGCSCGKKPAKNRVRSSRFFSPRMGAGKTFCKIKRIMTSSSRETWRARLFYNPKCRVKLRSYPAGKEASVRNFKNRGPVPSARASQHGHTLRIATTNDDGKMCGSPQSPRKEDWLTCVPNRNFSELFMGVCS